MRVLYVEDDDNLALAVEQMLRQAGHGCDRARTGVGGVKLGQATNYDVILLDVMLPDIDGYEVLRQLQSAGVQTPVLIQSGLVERDRAMDGLGFGVDDYLIKPFNRDELIGRVEQAAARAGRLPAFARSEPTAKPTEIPNVIALPPATDTTVTAEAAPVAEAAPAAEEPPAADDPPPDTFPALSAIIVTQDGQSDIECIVVSVASGGAVLNVHDEMIACPDDFMLAVAGDKSYRCQSCWRHGNKVGVKFV